MDAKKHHLKLDLKSTEKIAADKERLGQVITNLISNATKYSPHDGDIIISSMLENGFVKVDVIDSGIGVSTNALKGVFGRFYRAQSPEAFTFPGMGIRLSIVKIL